MICMNRISRTIIKSIDLVYYSNYSMLEQNRNEDRHLYVQCTSNVEWKRSFDGTIIQLKGNQLEMRIIILSKKKI